MGFTDFLKRRCGLLILLAVGSYSLLYAVAFVRLYFMMHPYVLSSYWIYENVPPGSRIVGPHWDDKVPVSIPGKSTSIYSMEGRDNELPVYERDTPQIISQLVNKISQSDYIMFPTARTPDSIPRIPDEYPNITALLRLLWGEKLGFTLVKTFKNRPSLLGITFNDDLADESFSVYDHPKVVIFRNEQRLSVTEIQQRIKDVQKFEPLPSMNEMLLMDQGGWQPRKPLFGPDLKVVAGALVLAVAVGFVIWALLGRLFRSLPDGGLGLSVGLGTVFAAAIAWSLGVLELVPLTRSGALVVLSALAAMALARISLRADVRSFLFDRLRVHGICVCVAVIGGALVSVVMRTSDPGFFGIGEHVDGAYLSYLSRNTDPRPQDLFQPGQYLPVRLADRFVLGWVLKVMAVDTALAVKAAAVLMGAILGGLLYSIVVTFTKRPRVALLFLMVTLIPAVYVLHAVRDSVNRGVVAGQSAALFERSPADLELATWVRETIQGTPCFVAACDEGGIEVRPATVGLPLCNTDWAVTTKNNAPATAELAVCKLDQPDAAFDGMMKLGIELFITPSSQVADSDVSKRRYEQFTQRPELFSRIFDNGRFAVFVPAFSRYFPRVKDPVSS